jgi:hypothetical protein
MTRKTAVEILQQWDAMARQREDTAKRKSVWKIIDCVQGWRKYDAEVKSAMDDLVQTATVKEIRTMIENQGGRKHE